MFIAERKTAKRPAFRKVGKGNDGQQSLVPEQQTPQLCGHGPKVQHFWSRSWHSSERLRSVNEGILLPQPPIRNFLYPLVSLAEPERG